MTVAKLAGGVLCMIIASLVLALLHPFGDPQRNLKQPDSALLQAAPMPDASRRVLVAKCADCHSDATHWPIYSRVAPVSWLIEHDVVEARKHLNLSQWQELSPDQQLVLEQEIVQQTRKRTMPPLPYRLIHWKAHLEPADREALLQLVSQETSESKPFEAGDADRGRALFNRRCSGCHATDSDREGPRLRGVYGRRAGSVPGFEYSSALRNSGMTWTDANLEKWLKDSESMLPGSAMGFSVPKPQERSDLIAFLKSLR